MVGTDTIRYAAAESQASIAVAMALALYLPSCNANDLLKINIGVAVARMVLTMTGTADIDFERVFATAPAALMILDRNLCFLAANGCYLAATKRAWPDLQGRYVFDAFPETAERQAVIHKGLQRGLAGEESSTDKVLFAIEQPDGSSREVHWLLHYVPVFGRDGAPIGVMQKALDITAEVEAQTMREIISQEYDHRVRNILAKVSAIARRTARSTETLGQFIAEFDPRIASMARAHKMLVHGGWEQLGLAELVNAELQPYAPQAPGQIVVKGANIMLSSRVAQAFGMALHELATNAVKYGALSTRTGSLRVAWTTDSDGALHFDWIESGLADIAVPSHAGFGSSIIDRILPTETGGTVDRQFNSSGLHCTIAVPAPHGA